MYDSTSPHGRRAHAGRPRRRRGPVLGPTIPRPRACRAPRRTWYSILARRRTTSCASRPRASAGNGTGGIFAWASGAGPPRRRRRRQLRVDLPRGSRPGGRSNTAAQAMATRRVRRVLRRRRLVPRNLAGTNRGRVTFAACSATPPATTPPPGQRAVAVTWTAPSSPAASVFAAASGRAGNNPNLRVTSGAGNGAALLEALYLAAPSRTHLHVSGSPVFDDGDDDGATFSGRARRPLGLVSCAYPTRASRTRA